jgi:hypothetical protein
MPRFSIIFATLVAARMTAAAAKADEPLSLPAAIDFTQPTLPADWEVVQPPGSSVTAKDSFLVIESPADR